MSSKDRRFRHLRRITWASWKLTDAFDGGKYSTFYVSVYEPTWERPFANILFRITNGGGSVFMRFMSVDDLREKFVIPECYIERLEDAMVSAGEMADRIEGDMRLALKIKGLKGQTVTVTPEGDLIAEVERVLRGE